MALPALALGWMLLAGNPAIKYKASIRVESVTRTPLLTETADSRVVADLMLAPRLEGVLYTNRLEVKFTGEPQLFRRQLGGQFSTFEVLTSVYTKAEYKLRRDFQLLAVHTTTYGTFPLDTFGGAGGGSLPVTPDDEATTSAYTYTETAAGFLTSLGVKRLNISATLGWIVNGLLDPPVRPARRGDAAYPQQRYPELRAQAFYGVTPRDYFTLFLYGRDVSFSTGNRDAILQFAPGLQHKFSPLLDVSVEPGFALGRVWPRRPDEPPYAFGMPTLDLAFGMPVPLGNHWPVKARLRARYLPYMDPLTTQLIPRGETGVELKWEGRRDAKVLAKLFYAQPFTSGVHKYDDETRAEFEGLWPLPLNRYLFLQAKGQFRWTHHVVLSEWGIVQWLTSIGLVVRYDRGRL
jgi:hypothetical protein